MAKLIQKPWNDPWHDGPGGPHKDSIDRMRAEGDKTWRKKRHYKNTEKKIVARKAYSTKEHKALLGEEGFYDAEVGGFEQEYFY